MNNYGNTRQWIEYEDTREPLLGIAEGLQGGSRLGSLSIGRDKLCEMSDNIMGFITAVDDLLRDLDSRLQKGGRR